MPTRGDKEIKWKSMSCWLVSCLNLCTVCEGQGQSHIPFNIAGSTERNSMKEEENSNYKESVVY